MDSNQRSLLAQLSGRDLPGQLRALGALPARLGWSAYLAAQVRGQARIPFRPSDAIARRRDDRVQQIVLHAARTVPYYRELFRRVGLSPTDFRTADDLARLPILEREDVQRDPDAFRSTEFPPDRCLRLSSGGSTGTPVVVWHNLAAVLQNAAHGERERSIYARLIGRSFGYRELVLGPLTGIARRVQQVTTTRSLLPNRLQIQRRFHSLLDPLDDAIRLMDEFQPDLVQGHGSYLALLFTALERRGVAFHHPRALSFNSDPMSGPARELIEGRFGIPVFSTYQAVEAFKIGFECDRGRGLHLNDDLYPLRLVDPDGHSLPVGEVGDVVVSNLVNRASVLLNYRIGDRAVADPHPCPCGRSLPLLAHLEGRRGETIRAADGREFSPIGLESAFWTELQSTRLYQVVHLTPDTLTWRIVPGIAADRDALRTALLTRCRVLFGDSIAAEIEFVDDVTRTASGKARRLITQSPDLRLPALSQPPGDRAFS